MFNGKDDCFFVPIGADGAPFGKNDSATAFLISNLNLLYGVASCNNNFVLMGSNCPETHPVMYSYVEHVVAEMEAIEGKTYTIKDKQYKFRCRLFPEDQKWHTSTFFSTYANVSTANFHLTGRSIGIGSNYTWKPWEYDNRLSDADNVFNFKTKHNLHGACTASQRLKVTQHIASLKSRQEFKPFLGKYINNAMPDPLHVSNKAWQKWHLQILCIAKALVNNDDWKKAGNDLAKLPKDCAFIAYFNCLENQVKCKRLVKTSKNGLLRKKEKNSATDLLEKR